MDIQHGNMEGNTHLSEENWLRYLSANSVESVGSDQQESEEKKYKDIVNHLETANVRRQNEGIQLILQRRQLLEEKKRFKAREIAKHNDELKIVLDVAANLEKSWAARRVADDEHKQHLEECAAARRRRLFSSRKISMVDNEDEDADPPHELVVTTNLASTTYYQDHPGGDYIFRFRKPTKLESPSVDKWANEVAGTSWYAWQDPIWSSCLDLDPDGIRSNFVYYGQVPRPAKEYIARLAVVIPQVIKAIAMIVKFVLSSGEVSPALDLDQLIISDLLIPRGRLLQLFQEWIAIFPCKSIIPDYFQQHLRSNTTALEYADLMGNITEFGQQRALLLELAPLSLMLVEGTGWKFSTMIEEYYMCSSEKAHNILFDEKNSKHMFIFEDDNVEVSYTGAEWLWHRCLGWVLSGFTFFPHKAVP